MEALLSEREGERERMGGEASPFLFTPIREEREKREKDSSPFLKEKGGGGEEEEEEEEEERERDFNDLLGSLEDDVSHSPSLTFGQLSRLVTYLHTLLMERFFSFVFFFLFFFFFSFFLFFSFFFSFFI